MYILAVLVTPSRNWPNGYLWQSRNHEAIYGQPRPWSRIFLFSEKKFDLEDVLWSFLTVKHAWCYVITLHNIAWRNLPTWKRSSWKNTTPYHADKWFCFIYIYKHPSRYTWCNLECVWLFPHLPTNPNILSLTEVIITGDSAECTIPGGWGATGAPNDGWHQYIHLLTHAYGSVRMQTHHSFALRKQLSELDMSVQSAPSTKNLDSTHYI